MTAAPPILNTVAHSAARIFVSVALPAIIGEAVQHLIEFKLGMYVRGDGIAAGHEMNLRMIGAAVKVIGFLYTIFLARSRSDILSQGKSMPLVTKTIAIALPLLAHYVLNYEAVGKPDWIVLVLIFLDCLVIGSLALAIGLIMPKQRMGRHR